MNYYKKKKKQGYFDQTRGEIITKFLFDVENPMIKFVNDRRINIVVITGVLYLRVSRRILLLYHLVHLGNCPTDVPNFVFLFQNDKFLHTFSPEIIIVICTRRFPSPLNLHGIRFPFYFITIKLNEYQIGIFNSVR